MGRVSVGNAINEGFRLIQRAPIPVLIWGVSQLIFVIIVVALLSPLYIAIFEAARAGASNPDALQSINSQAQSMQGFSLLIDAFQVVMYAVVYCAVFRAVLRPEDSRFAYFRLGMAELFVGALLVGGYFVLFAGIFFAAIVVGIIVGILVAVHLVPVAILIGLVGGVAMLAGTFYVLLRVSLVGPMIVDDNQFHFQDAWRITRGQVLSLFLIGLVMALIAVAAEIVIGIVYVAIGLGALSALAGGLQNLGPFLQQPQVLLKLAPLLVIAAVIWAPFIGCLTALMAAPWARAYRDLKPPDIAATFV